MPPLRSNPEIYVAASQSELDVLFGAFEKGLKHYVEVKGSDDGQIHLFTPTDGTMMQASVALIRDGLISNTVMLHRYITPSEYTAQRQGGAPEITAEDSQKLQETIRLNQELPLRDLPALGIFE